MGDLKVVQVSDVGNTLIPADILEMYKEEFTKRIDYLFLEYCCGGDKKPKDVSAESLELSKKIFEIGYKAGQNDLLSKLSGKDWEGKNNESK